MAEETRSERLNEVAGRLGKSLVSGLFVLFKTSFNYSEGHQALEAPIANLLTVIDEVQQQDTDANLRIRAGHLYLEDLRLRMDMASFDAGRFVIEEMKRHLVGSITFAVGVSAEDVRRFIYAFRELDLAASPDRFLKLLERMHVRGVEHIVVEALATDALVEGDPEQQHDEKTRARSLYQRAVTQLGEAAERSRARLPLRLRAPKRVVQQMIDLMATDEAPLLGLTTLRGRHGASHHPVNVCILSLALGARLGLSRFHLCELGMAALFHDIGKAHLPGDIVDKQSKLTAEEQQAFERHPVLGVRNLMRAKVLDQVGLRMVTGAFEHHLLADFSGYPRLSYRRHSLLGSIIGIADRYDILASPEAGRPPLPPDRVLRYMLRDGDHSCHRPLLKLFANVVGVHGIGSLLLLDSNELAVVVANNPDRTRWDAPRVRIIADADGREVVEGEEVDLGDPAAGRLIVANLDPHPFGLDVSRYFT